uniref:Uncharacterized protein n=1 Tax=Acrobeloides nanus TaxID=290746 RepID=A0A914EHW2_9BILA
MVHLKIVVIMVISAHYKGPMAAKLMESQTTIPNRMELILQFTPFSNNFYKTYQMVQNFHLRRPHYKGPMAAKLVKPQTTIPNRMELILQFSPCSNNFYKA